MYIKQFSVVPVGHHFKAWSMEDDKIRTFLKIPTLTDAHGQSYNALDVDENDVTRAFCYFTVDELVYVTQGTIMIDHYRFDPRTEKPKIITLRGTWE